jgi:hypothetical protein
MLAGGGWLIISSIDEFPKMTHFLGGSHPFIVQPSINLHKLISNWTLNDRSHFLRRTLGPKWNECPCYFHTE